MSIGDIVITNFAPRMAPDFNLTTDEVVIAAEATEPCVVFTALADSLALEGQEMLTLSLSGPENVIISNATVNIIINDANGMYLYT